jgi:hypothetical protein
LEVTGNKHQKLYSREMLFGKAILDQMTINGRDDIYHLMRNAAGRNKAAANRLP